MSAFLFLQIGTLEDWDEARKLHDAIHGVDGVKSVHFLMGPTDMVVYLEAADQEQLMENIAKIRSMGNVERTDTRIVIPM